ncbi:hypothetical protein RFI_29967 [Reticulomyxa filosa]|uniref:Uncharacterized protein n=1 Tax=Reticulomyxa filosa TaxID=46433 RepID=X6M340_RETFI|nr:hypothetical protein RFI_29967 [Reticulomyxa filosa]|eukprot:ETO07435.1 hypothetical protein RFI_29967 [Reticulomyxa filosa]
MTLIIKSVDGRKLKSASSVNWLVVKQFESKSKHTFSQTWRTLFVHFDNQKINGEGLERIAISFNELHQQENKEEKEQKKKKKQMKCVVYNPKNKENKLFKLIRKFFSISKIFLS